MGMLFRNSDLEVRFSMNMNVLIDGVTPRVCSLKDVLRAFLGHRQEVLLRRSRFRLGKIDHRLEVLEGLIVALLNLDRVIDIIRYDDDPKAGLMFENWSVGHARATSEADYVSPLPPRDPEDPSLSDVQAEAILNMRLRSLRRLEEIELLRERDALMAERAEIEDLLYRAIHQEVDRVHTHALAEGPAGAASTSPGETPTPDGDSDGGGEGGGGEDDASRARPRTGELSRLGPRG